MKISVIVPTYGRSEFLERAFHSLEKQSYKEFEVILIDDNVVNSVYTVDVLKIVNQFKGSLDIKYIKTTGQIGSANARNEGIEFAKGEYISFLDDDDLYLPDKLLNQLKILENNNFDAAITNLILIDQNMKLVEYRTHKELKETTDIKQIMRYHLLFHLTGTSSLMIKRNVIYEIGLFTSIDIGDEFYLVYKLLVNNYKLGYIDSNDVICNIHTNQQGLSTSEKKLDGIASLEEFKKNNLDRLNTNDINVMEIRSNISEIMFLLRNRRFNIRFFKLILKLLVNPFITVKLFLKYSSVLKKKEIQKILDINVNLIKINQSK